MILVHEIYSDPGLLTVYATLYLTLTLLILLIIYRMIANRRFRVTTLYLSGEPEDVINTPTPSPANLYWGFIKRLARGLYTGIRDRMHTGNLQDWVRFMASWYGFLLLLSIILGIIYMVG
jgi:hypothetical protein